MHKAATVPPPPVRVKASGMADWMPRILLHRRDFLPWNWGDPGREPVLDVLAGGGTGVERGPKVFRPGAEDQVAFGLQSVPSSPADFILELARRPLRAAQKEARPGI